MPKKKYYAFSVNGKNGITDTWAECQKKVSGIPSARYKSFPTKEEAERWLDAGADYNVKHVAIEDGIYFDAGTGAGNGVEISVTDKTGKSLLNKATPKLKINPRGFHLIPERVTNNFGELLACKYALQIALSDKVKQVFGDSALVIDFWSKGYIKKENMPEETLALAAEVKILRKEFEAKGGIITAIPGSSNPADLGFHKG